MNIVLGIAILLLIPFYIGYLYYQSKNTARLYKPQCWLKEEPIYLLLLGVHILFIGMIISFAVLLLTL